MIGVLVLAGTVPDMHGLDAERSPSMLPLGDRPALQHVVESLVTQGITSIEIIASHAPERVEFVMGNGDRWGSNFRYHLAADPDRPYRSLKVIPALGTEPWVLIHAERYPCINFRASAAEHAGRPILYSGAFHSRWGSPESKPNEWGGTVLMPAAEIDDRVANANFVELEEYLRSLVSSGIGTEAVTTGWLDVSTPTALLHSQSDLLSKKLPGLLINGIERRTGIWISRNVTLHPTASLEAPLYIGPNSRVGRDVRLGPNVVIGTNCIVDAKTSLMDAMVTGGSYIGEALEVHSAIVSHNLLVNARLNASVDIAEDFLIGRLERAEHARGVSRGAESLVATGFFLIFLPVTMLGLLVWLMRGVVPASVRALCLPADDRPSTPRTFALPCLGADAWAKVQPAGWWAFTRQFLPGLLAVILGHARLVGLPPRSPEQVAELADDWRELYLQGHAGLITEASIATPADADEMQLYLADAYFSVRRSKRHNFGVMVKYFCRLFTPTPRL
jgi:NDP-sugar pyrophosphorylase family protein